MKNIHDFLREKHACFEGRKFTGSLTKKECEEKNIINQKELTVEEIVDTIERGDWLLWLAKRVNMDIKPLTLAKARCAKTVIHLMQDQRSIDAVNLAEKFGLTDEVTLENLQSSYNAAAYAAASAAANANANAYAADAAANAAANANAYAYAADAAANAAANANAYANAYAYAAAAKKKNQQQTADICRETFRDLLIELIYKKLNNYENT